MILNVFLYTNMENVDAIVKYFFVDFEKYNWCDKSSKYIHFCTLCCILKGEAVKSEKIRSLNFRRRNTKLQSAFDNAPASTHKKKGDCHHLMFILRCSVRRWTFSHTSSRVFSECRFSTERHHDRADSAFLIRLTQRSRTMHVQLDDRFQQLVQAL